MGYHYRTDILANFMYKFAFTCSSMYHTIIQSVIAEINCTNMYYNSNRDN